MKTLLFPIFQLGHFLLRLVTRLARWRDIAWPMSPASTDGNSVFHLQCLTRKRNSAQVAAPSVEFASRNPLLSSAGSLRALPCASVPIFDNPNLFRKPSDPLPIYRSVPLFISLIPCPTSNSILFRVSPVTSTISLPRLVAMLLPVTPSIFLNLRPMTHGVRSTLTISAKFAFRFSPVGSAAICIEVVKGLRFFALRAALLGYDFSSQGVNLLRLGLALVRPVRVYQHSFGSLCILAHKRGALCRY